MRTQLVAIALGLLVGTAAAQDVKATARTVAQKSQKAVATVRLVVKVSFGEREQEVKHEVTGTVIDPSGLTVVSAASLEPLANRGFGGRGGRGGPGGGGGGQMRVDTEVSETTLVIDETEVDAEVVLKDQELDLAFVKPKESKTFECVKLEAGEKTVQLLDEVFSVSRLGAAGNHAIAVSTGTIKSVVKGPRSFYVCDDALAATSLGCLAYAADGSVIGVFVTRRAAEGRGSISIVRPLKDVVELAEQARSSKKGGEKPAEKKPAEKKPAEKKPNEKGDDF